MRIKLTRKQLQMFYTYILTTCTRMFVRIHDITQTYSFPVAPKKILMCSWFAGWLAFVRVLSDMLQTTKGRRKKTDKIFQVELYI